MSIGRQDLTLFTFFFCFFDDGPVDEGLDDEILLVGSWSLITSVRLIQVGNNRNDHFGYFLGVRVRLIEVSA